LNLTILCTPFEFGDNRIGRKLNLMMFCKPFEPDDALHHSMELFLGLVWNMLLLRTLTILSNRPIPSGNLLF
jgi:hypothetical protein